MQKVIRSYIFDGKSFEELQKALDEGYVVVMANKVGNVMMLLNTFLKRKTKKSRLMLLLKV